MKKNWKGWLSLCLAFVLSFIILPAAVNADGEYANLKLYTGSARVTSDMYVSADTGTYAEDVNENCPLGYRRDGYKVWRLNESGYTVASRWVSDNGNEWAAQLTGFFAPETVMLAPNWVTEYSAEPITAENPTVVIGDGSAQDRGDFYYQWLHERKVVDIGNYYDEHEQIKGGGSNAVYNSEVKKWIAGTEQPYMEVRLSLQRGDIVAVKNISGGANAQQYFSGYLKTPNGSSCLETYDKNNDVFYVTALSGGDCILHMQNNLEPYNLQAAVTVSRDENEDGAVGSKTYSGEDGSYCCKISYVRNGSMISFLTNSVTIKKNESGGNEPKEFAIHYTEAENGSYAAKINGAKIDKASPGQTVTIETYPSTGYKTQVITYRKTDDASGEKVIVPMGGDGNGCFVMPEYDVTIEVSFQKDSSEVKPSQPPKIEIRLDGTNYVWSSFTGKVAFDAMSNKAERFRIVVSDVDNDVDFGTIKYHLAEKNLFPEDKNYTLEQIEAAIGDNWKDLTDTVDVNSDGKYVLYVKASDKVGNTSYANSQGIVIDMTAPVISGVEDKQECYGAVEFTVEDAYLDFVTIDGKKAEPNNGVYTVLPDNASHSIVAADLAGNKVSFAITVYETWVRDGIEKSGVYALKTGTAYHLGQGTWKIMGDETVYTGGLVIYVPESKDYDFRKQ